MRLGARKSIVWNFFKKADDKLVTCILCKRQMKYFVSTTNLIQHLIRRHPIQYKEGAGELNVNDGETSPVANESICNSQMEATAAATSLSEDNPLKACRTCTQPITSNEYFLISGSSYLSSGLVIKQLLESCIPECDLNLAPNSAICRNCMSALHISYCFKQETIKNEEAFRKSINTVTRGTSGEVEIVYGGEESQKQEAFEVELTDLTDLKVEFVYDDIQDVAENAPIIEENIDSVETNLQISNEKTLCIEQASRRMKNLIHTSEKPFHCTKCSYKAKHKAYLRSHMKIHTGERPYPCPSCDKRFITKQIMKRHSLIHTGEKPYHCMHCNFQFRHKGSIVNHMKKVHQGITQLTDRQLLVCYICGKCFSWPESLTTHMRVHTGVKSHLCELCGRHFRERGILRNHLRTHTGEKPFKCSECDYMATRKAHVQDHMKTHVGKPALVECSECGKRYATKLLLKKHLKAQHRTEVAQW